MSKLTIIRQGNIRGNKTLYPDGVGCCIWYPLNDKPEDEDCGISFDFPFDEVDDLIALLEKLKAAEPDIFVDAEP